MNQVVIAGTTWGGRRLWNLKRTVVVTDNPVLIGSGGFEIDFATAPDTRPLAILNRNPPENGWNLVPPNLQIGYTPNYADNVNSDALLLANLTGLDSAQLHFALEFDTEPGFDFIEVFVTEDDENQVVLFRQSGAQPLTSYTFDISPFAGQDKVEIHFRFTSDGSVTSAGVRLQRIAITQ